MRGLLALLITMSASGAELTLPRGDSRSLPRGEERPEVVQAFYTSAQGEVHFTHKSGYLRQPSGNLLAFDEVRGASACLDWMQNPRTEVLPKGCNFVFVDRHDGRTESVRSDQLELMKGELNESL